MTQMVKWRLAILLGVRGTNVTQISQPYFIFFILDYNVPFCFSLANFGLIAPSIP